MAGTWTGWHSVGGMLDAGDVPVPVVPGSYAFRIRPDLGVVPSGCPIRLIDIGGMGSTGSLYGRVCTFIGAGLGRYQMSGAGPPHSAGLNFSHYRSRTQNAWTITVRDLDVAFVIAPVGHEHYCGEVSTWHWYSTVFAPAAGTTATYPWCCSSAKKRCSHPGGPAAHAWYRPPPAP